MAVAQTQNCLSTMKPAFYPSWMSLKAFSQSNSIWAAMSSRSSIFIICHTPRNCSRLDIVISSLTGPMSRLGGNGSVCESHGKRSSLCLECAHRLSVSQKLFRIEFFHYSAMIASYDNSLRQNNAKFAVDLLIPKDYRELSFKLTTNSDTQDQS